jgi:hypothetical protein
VCSEPLLQELLDFYIQGVEQYLDGVQSELHPNLEIDLWRRLQTKMTTAPHFYLWGGEQSQILATLPHAGA